MNYFRTQNNNEEQSEDSGNLNDFLRQEIRYRIPSSQSRNDFHRRPESVPYPPKVQFQANRPSPAMEYFGPRDIVPDSPYLLQGGHQSVSPFSGHQPLSPFSYQHPPSSNKQPMLRLEPKPRSLFRYVILEYNPSCLNYHFHLVGKEMLMRIHYQDCCKRDLDFSIFFEG